MRIEFVDRDNGPERLLCEAELMFETEGPLAGMKLVGISLWRGADGETYVTFPARAFGAGSDRKYFDFLRASDGSLSDSRRVKAWIVEEYQTRKRAA